MAVRARNPWLRMLLASVAAGCSGFLALWLITRFLLARGIAPQSTYIDEFLVGILVALLILALELYHEAKLRRIRQAAQLMGQLNHYIRNSLQVILYSSSMPPSEVSQEAIRASVYRIQWVLEKLIQESELFSGARTYLGKDHVEVDLASLLKKPPELASEHARGAKEQGKKKQAG